MQSEIKHQPVRLFESGDGCTLFPDGWLGYDWRQCCDVHDVAFETGQTIQDFAVANYDLWQCVMTRGDVFAATLVLIGVMTGGAVFYIAGRLRRRT